MSVNVQRQGKQSQVKRNEIPQISQCRDNRSIFKNKNLKYCRSQYAKTKKVKWNIQNTNTGDSNRQGRGNQVKYTELKNCRCQYAERKKAKWNMQK